MHLALPGGIEFSCFYHYRTTVASHPHRTTQNVTEHQLQLHYSEVQCSAEHRTRTRSQHPQTQLGSFQDQSA